MDQPKFAIEATNKERLLTQLRAISKNLRRLLDFFSLLFFSKHVPSVAMPVSHRAKEETNPKNIALNIMTLWMIDFGKLTHPIEQALRSADKAIDEIGDLPIHVDSPKYIDLISRLERQYAKHVKNVTQLPHFNVEDFSRFMSKPSPDDFDVPRFMREGENSEQAGSSRSQFPLAASFGRLSGKVLPNEWFDKNQSMDPELLSLVERGDEVGVVNYLIGKDQEEINAVAQEISIERLAKKVLGFDGSDDLEEKILESGAAKEDNILRVVLESQVHSMKTCITSAGIMLKNGDVKAAYLPKKEKDDGTYHQHDVDLLLVGLIAEYAEAYRCHSHHETMSRSQFVEKQGEKIDVHSAEKKAYSTDISTFHKAFQQLVDMWPEKNEKDYRNLFNSSAKKFHNVARSFLRLNSDQYQKMTERMKSSLHGFIEDGNSLRWNPRDIFVCYHPKFNEGKTRADLEILYRIESGWFHPLFCSASMGVWDGSKHSITSRAYDREEEAKAMNNGRHHFPSVFLTKLFSRPDLLDVGVGKRRIEMLCTASWKYLRQREQAQGGLIPKRWEEDVAYADAMLASAMRHLRKFQELYIRSTAKQQAGARDFVRQYAETAFELRKLKKIGRNVNTFVNAVEKKYLEARRTLGLSDSETQSSRSKGRIVASNNLAAEVASLQDQLKQRFGFDVSLQSPPKSPPAVVEMVSSAHFRNVKPLPLVFDPAIMGGAVKLTESESAGASDNQLMY